MGSSTTGTPTALDECLARYGTDHASLVASVDDVIGLRRGDLVLAVGSGAERLGNSKSDLDLLLVAGDGDGGRAETERCWAIGHRMVDLRILRSGTVERLTGRLRDWARLPWNLVELAPFDYDERLLLHRLLEGLQVYPTRPHPGEHPSRPRRPDLARLKLQVARHLARTIQVDMVGYRDERDYATLGYAAQDLLGQSVDGLLAGHHLTNPNPKWRSRLLERLPADWDRPLRMRPTGLRPDRLLWDLHRAPVEPRRELAVSHALRCVTFARVVFAWAERRIVGRAALDNGSYAWAPEEGRTQGQHLPGLEFDVDFFFSDAGIAVARLNEFGASLPLSEREFALLQLFDGQTSVVEAESMVNGALDGRAEPLDVRGTVERVLRSGLCLEPPAVQRTHA